MNDPNNILCIGGPLDGLKVIAKELDDETRLQYDQYKSEWNKRTFILVHKSLL